VSDVIKPPFFGNPIKKLTSRKRKDGNKNMIALKHLYMYTIFENYSVSMTFESYLTFFPPGKKMTV